MKTRLIELEDGTLVEVEKKVGPAQRIAGGAAEKVGGTFEKIQPIVARVCRSLSGVWSEVGQSTYVDQAEIEIGLSFEGEGSVFVTKSKAAANLSVKLVLKPRVES